LWCGVVWCGVVWSGVLYFERPTGKGSKLLGICFFRRLIVVIKYTGGKVK